MRAVLAFGVMASLTLGACSPKSERYTTRGLVRAVEGEGADLRVAIAHERIEGFKDRDGKRAPMPSMSMIFGLADPAKAAGLTAGTKLVFTFEMRWDDRPSLLITRLERLPASTALVLSDAH